MSPILYRILLALTVSQTGLGFGDRDRLEGADRVCHGVSLSWCWSRAFLITPGYEFGAGRPGERPWRHVAPWCFRVALMLAGQRLSGLPCDILSPLPRTVLLERQRLQSPLNGWGALRRRRTSVRYLDSAALETCLSPPVIYLFNHLFIALWTHGYLFYTLCFNPCLLCVVPQIVPARATAGAKVDMFREGQ